MSDPQKQPANITTASFCGMLGSHCHHEMLGIPSHAREISSVDICRLGILPSTLH